MKKSKIVLTAFLFITAGICMSCAKAPESQEPQTYVSHDEGLEVETTTEQKGDLLTVHSDSKLIDDLSLIADGSGCFQQEHSQNLDTIRLCQTSAQISLSAEMPNVTGALTPVRFLFHKKQRHKDDPTLNVELPKLETPRAYTLDELRSIASGKSFSSRQEFINLMAARSNMRLHYMNLLPHLTINSILAVATAGPLGVLASIGDLVPFLLPNRWNQAKEASHLHKAEVHALAIAREDAAQLVEGLALSVARDQATYEQLASLRPLLASTVTLIQGLEKTGRPDQLAPGRSRDVESPLNLLDEAVMTLSYVVESERAELSTAVGFTNPEAIRSIDIGTPADIHHPQDFTAVDLGRDTIRTAKEISQFSEFIEAAKANQKSKAFEWLDPSGDPQSGLGAGLPSFIEIAKSRVKLIEVQLEQTKSVLLKKAAQASQNLHMNLKSYGLSTQGLALQNARFETAIAEIKKTPNDTPVGELQDILQQLPTQYVNRITAEYSWYLNLSQIHRLTHTGPYATAGK